MQTSRNRPSAGVDGGRRGARTGLALLIALSSIGGLSLPALATPVQIANGSIYDADQERYTDPRRAAEHGDAEAQYGLASAYRYGFGIKPDPAAARTWFECAAKQGHVWSQFELAEMLLNGIGGPRDTAGAVALYRKAAEQGEVRAAARLGHLLRTGEVIDADPFEAMKWLAFSASCNDGMAQFEIALSLAQFEDRDQGTQMAVTWLERAASQLDVARRVLGEVKARLRRRESIHPDAMAADWAKAAKSHDTEASLLDTLATRYGIGRHIDERAARTRLEALAHKGSAPAMYYLADLLREGVDTAKVDPAKPWYMASARAGFAPAEMVMAIYDAMDHAKAIEWLRKAARQGLPEAQAQAGNWLFHDDKTRSEGRDWLLKAAENGSASAANDLASEGELGEANGQPTFALRWLAFAAERGVEQAQERLGDYYLERGDKQASDGVAWLEKAAAQRSNNAAGNLARAYDEGKKLPRDLPKAAHWYLRSYALEDENGLVGLLALLDEPGEHALPYADMRAVFEKEAARGNTFARYGLGWLQLHGKGTPRDAARALENFTRAAAAGDGRSMTALGDMYASGDGVPGNDATALAWYRKASTISSAGAVRLARMLLAGRGAPRDPKSAIALLEEAARNDFAEAENLLGELYQRGDGVPLDLAKAKQYYDEAAEHGSEAARRHLDDFLVENGRVRLIPHGGRQGDLTKRAASGDPLACFQLGQRLLDARDETRDVEGGLAWLQKAAEHGYVPAQFDLANRLLNGVWVNRGSGGGEQEHIDRTAALRWYRTAAQAGSVEAQLALVNQLSYGSGSERQEAFKWCLAAAKAGNPAAEYLVATKLATGDGTPIDGRQAVRWAEAAAKQEQAGAYQLLGNLYLDGKALPRDAARALAWYLAGARAGDTGAQEALADMYRDGVGTPKNAKEALRWYETAASEGGSEPAFSAARLSYFGPAEVRNPSRGLKWYLTAILDEQEGGDGTGDYGLDEFAPVAREYPNYAAACYALARRLELGDGLPRDPQGAFNWYGTAAGLVKKYPTVGAIATLQLGRLQAASGHPKEALESYQEAMRVLITVQAGDRLELLTRLASRYDSVHDVEKILTALQQAAHRGDAVSAYALGWLFQHGCGVPRNARLAARWLGQANAKGLTAARVDEATQLAAAGHSAEALARFRELARTFDQLEAAPWTAASSKPTLKSSPEFEHVLAEYDRALRAAKIGPYEPPHKENVIDMEMVMVPSEPLSPTELRAWARSHAISYAAAANWWQTAQLETRAELAPTDRERFRLMHQSAELGSGKAMLALAGYYSIGKGCRRDPVAAYQWLLVAGAAGAEDEIFPTPKAKPDARGIARAEEEAWRWWRQHHRVPE